MSEKLPKSQVTVKADSGKTLKMSTGLLRRITIEQVKELHRMKENGMPPGTDESEWWKYK